MEKPQYNTIPYMKKSVVRESVKDKGFNKAALATMHRSSD